MFRVYVYYFRSSRNADFDRRKEALDYAYRIANGGKALHIVVENIEVCEILLELYPEV